MNLKSQSVFIPGQRQGDLLTIRYIALLNLTIDLVVDKNRSSRELGSIYHSFR